jgi:chaperone BCS1
MAAYMPLVQQFLSGFITQLDPAANIFSNATAASAANATTLPPLTMPTDLPSLLTLLLSFSALREWAKLAIIGGFIEICRRFVFGGYTKVVNSFFITACFEEQDSSYGGSTIR